MAVLGGIWVGGKFLGKVSKSVARAIKARR